MDPTTATPTDVMWIRKGQQMKYIDRVMESVSKVARISAVGGRTKSR